MQFKQFYEQKEQKPYDDFIDFLRKKGWSQIGFGSFGTVFGKSNKNYVIKVYHDDPAYERFLDFIEQNQNDPHIPKINRRIIRQPKDSRDSDYDYGVVAIEKLGKLERSRWRWDMVPLFQKFLKGIGVLNLSFDEYIDKSIKSVRQDLQEDIDFYKDNPHGKYYSHSYRKLLKRLDYFVESNLGLFKTFYKFKKFLEDNNATHKFDLHSGNFMIRPSTGEIVVIDPIAY